MNKQYITYKAIGTIKGNIWMPNIECTKDFNINFSKDNSLPFTTNFETLEDIKNHITNDGDFRSCEISEGELIVTLHYGNRTISHCLDLINKN